MLDAPPEISHIAPLAFFNDPEVAKVQEKLFGVARRDREVSNRIQSIKERLKDDIYAFMAKFRMEVLIPENILAIPMHVPLGLAMTEVIAETGTRDVVEQVRAVLHDKSLRDDWSRINYDLGLKYFSYSVARRKLAARLANLFGEGV